MGPDSHGLVDRRDEELAVADLARAGGFDDRRGHRADEGVCQDDLDFDLWQEIDRVLAADRSLCDLSGGQNL